MTCSTKVSLSGSSIATTTLSYPLARRTRVNIERGRAGRHNETDLPNVNYVGLIFLVKLYSCNSFLSTSSAYLVVRRAFLVV